jgi:hypothetical protein
MSLFDNKIIPERNNNALSGTEVLKNNWNITGNSRENNFINEVLSGNVPDFWRNFTPITITKNGNSIVCLVSPDYLSVGNDNDYVRIPLSPIGAQKIANAFDCILPTKKMVDEIWHASVNQLNPLPWGPPYDNSMQNSDRIKIHNDRIQNQLSGKDYSKLTSGHKKDVILTNRLFPNNPNKKVAIYGWILPDGSPIQGINAASHDYNYADYSHGIRLIANQVLLNGSLTSFKDVASDPNYCYLVSEEGPLKFFTYDGK